MFKGWLFFETKNSKSVVKLIDKLIHIWNFIQIFIIIFSFLFLHVPTYNLSFLSVASATDPLLKLVSLTFPYFHNPYAIIVQKNDYNLEREREREKKRVWKIQEDAIVVHAHLQPVPFTFQQHSRTLLVFNTATSSPIINYYRQASYASSSRTIPV